MTVIIEVARVCWHRSLSTEEEHRRHWRDARREERTVNALVRKLESMGYSIKSSVPRHHWVDGACGYCVCSANTKHAACRKALALISRERKRKGVGCASWYLPNPMEMGTRHLVEGTHPPVVEHQNFESKKEE